MGYRWLHDLPAALAGLGAEFYSGWENRSRSSGGYDELLGVCIHHTASSTSPESDMRYMWETSSDGPVGAIYLSREGRIVVGAAGATNTQGKGGPLHTSRGTVPLDKGNQTLLAVEAANAGTGEPWPEVQTSRYVDLVRALCSWYGLEPVSDVFGHFDYCAPSCPARKIDPAGPSPFGTVNGSGTWDIHRFRGAVLSSSPAPTPPTTTSEEIDMLALDLGTPGVDEWWTRLTYTGDTLCHVVSPADQLQARGKVPTVPVSEVELSALLDTVTTVGRSPFGAGQAPNAALDNKWNTARGRG